MQADGPLDRKFWLGRTDPRPLAALRIGLGLLLLFQLADLARSFDALYTPDSFFPSRSAFDPNAFGLFQLLPSRGGAVLLLGAYAIALTAYVVGWQTRWASVAAWALCVSFHHRNPVYMSGGDWMAQLMLFWSIFADTGAIWSLDARRRGAAGSVFAAPLRAMQLHVALMYFITGRLKYIGTWRSGWGVYLSLDLGYFNRPPGSWMHAHPALCRFTNHAVLALELLFLFMAFSPIANRFGQLAAAVTNVAVQLGVLATMKVGAFTGFMLVATVLFIPPFVWERAFGPLPKPREPEPRLEMHPGRWAVVSVLALAILLIAWDPFVGRRFPMPHAVSSARVAIGIDQPYALFDRLYPQPTWQASGVRSDGSAVDLIPIVAPGLTPSHDWLADFWVKAAFNLHTADGEDLARFFCRAYGRARSETLSSVRVVLQSRLQSIPGTPDNPVVTRVFHDGACP
jgi:hypothetical protein